MTASNTIVAKAVAVVAALMMVATSFAFVPVAKAQSSADLQAQINALLATIAALQAQLAGTTGGSTGTTTTACTFTRDLTLNSEGADVTCLQNYLKATGHFTHPTATGFFGPITRTAVAAWQAANGVTPAAGYFGSISRAKYTAVAGTVTPGTPGTGTGTIPTGTAFRVALASDSPANTALVQGQGIGELAKFTFSNPTSAEVRVTGLTFNRIGVSNDSTLSNVYLYDGGTRITDSAGISNSQFSFNDPTGVVTVPAMSTKTISVRSDIASGSAGQVVGVALVSVSTTATLDSSVSFPINSGMQSISAADLAAVSFNAYTGPSNATMNPENDSRVFEATINVGTRAVNLSSITLENRGSTNDSDFRNLKLFVDGNQVGSTVNQTSGKKVTFSFATPVRLETGNRVIRLNADIVGGSGDTFDFRVRRSADVMFIDSQLGQPITVSTASNFGAGTANTVAAATLSVTRAANSPQSNISVDATSVKIASFEFRAAGENVKVEEMTVTATSNVSNGGLDNGKVFLNGVQIGSTRDIASAGTAFTFGSQMILQQGETAIVDIYADAKTTTGASLANGEQITSSVTITGSNTEGMDSGDSLSGTIGPVSAFTITVSSASLAASQFSGYSAQTMVAGANNAKIGSFTLSAGSTEGVNVNNIVIDMSAANAASITDLRLMDGGTQLGTAKASPSSSNSFSVNFSVPTSGTKTIDVIANIKSGADAGTIVATLAATSGGTGAKTGSSITVGSGVTLQTITIGVGSLTVSVGAGDPNSNNVIAGASQIKVGEFNFAAANTAFTVQELKVALPGAASAVTGVTLRYQDSNGTTQTVTQSVVSSGANATASFTGLTFFVPANSDSALEVLVGTPTTAQSSTVSGTAINVSLAGGAGHFKAVDTAGNQETTLAATDVFSGGTFYPRRSIPTVALVNNPGTYVEQPGSGQDLYRFTVTADAAGAIDWNKISFAVSTTSLTASGFTLYDVTGGLSTAMNTVAVNANGSGIVAITANNPAIQQVGAGQTKTYALRAASVVGWATGSQITISFAEDSSAVANAAVSGLSASNIIWSDRSATGHSVSTADWTNGFLLKDLATDIKQHFKN